jgi:hypothetical protein
MSLCVANGLSLMQLFFFNMYSLLIKGEGDYWQRNFSGDVVDDA